MEILDNINHEWVNNRLKNWSQGDCVVGEQWFLFRTSIDYSLTKAGLEAARENSENAELIVRGFAVITQTCDLIRDCNRRPFVEISPLIEVKKTILHEIERGRRPNYAFIVGIAEKHLVADLDRVMTVEKSVVANWKRVQGCYNDNDIRRLSLALARKRARTAFPDDFVKFVTPLTNRMSKKHDKKSDEGDALQALREIRVHASPSWTANEVELIFWFIQNEQELFFKNEKWVNYVEKWKDLMPKSGRFINVRVVVRTLDTLTAREYVESDPLDFDHLSTRNS